MQKQAITIDYFSDILCVWAYVAQIRLDTLKREFSEQIVIRNHFITLFGDTRQRIGEGWADKGGYAAFNRHVTAVVQSFEQVQINPEVWASCRPLTSANSHLFLKAIQILEDRSELENSDDAESTTTTLAEEITWRVRCAFFLDARNIGDLNVLYAIAEELRIMPAAIELLIKNGTAMAALSADTELQSKYKLDGSPTYLLNNGRQKLFGNVGYKIIEANIVELLRFPENRASWC